MALVEIFPSLTQQDINRALLRCQARATVYVKENTAGKNLSPDFEELLNDMEKLNSIALVRSPGRTTLINSLEFQLTNNGKIK